ncbi:hypothetical protein BKN14_05450 [Candidatus Gracilibacteria bacterium HOT-871]|nr:hypothetical protein BKN14_05450 [Candidatus Gracilibacteria bacterium HOT-871]MBB1564905.1 hypothetical protein [Candidatus Gracilibacteria bacterium]RKW23484.1 MAG: hypothetical protein D8B46_03320 [Candidatus Gracilibacteria bacterium]RKW24023.1 MAG: hypothetical protein D8B46_02210 [Candidatus Gracilibacteria bacterium]
MNTKLEKLFEKYNFSQKDRFEISQIFFLLTEERKQNLLKNFDEFALSINKINSDIDTEKDILIGSAVEKIKNSILEERKNKIDENIKDEINSLKDEI